MLARVGSVRRGGPFEAAKIVGAAGKGGFEVCLIENGEFVVVEDANIAFDENIAREIARRHSSEAPLVDSGSSVVSIDGIFEGVLFYICAGSDASAGVIGRKGDDGALDKAIEAAGGKVSPDRLLSSAAVPVRKLSSFYIIFYMILVFFRVI